MDPADLDYILVPGLLFSATSGHRLGYGKGFFDRALGGLLSHDPRPLFVGFGFEAQVEAELPSGDQDVPLDVLVTEARTILYSALARARLC
jgi:5-formyltetrahydrofolate cyclo-ligase